MVRNGSRFIINGDVCLKEMRHKEYVLERKRYDSYKNTKKNDRHYLKKMSFLENIRQFKYIQSVVVSFDEKEQTISCGDMIVHLINLDAFWDFSPERKSKQLGLLKELCKIQ